MRHVASMPLFDADLDLGSGSAGHRLQGQERAQVIINFKFSL